MSDHAIEHDYHLVDPSPWPFLAGISTVVWGLGFVIFFAGLYPRSADAPNGLMEFFFSKGMDMFGPDKVSNGGWFFLLLGSLMGIWVMICWWSDVLKEGKQGDHTPVVQLGLRYGMIMFLMQEVLFFAAWFWMFFEFVLFRKGRAGWDSDVIQNGSSYLDSLGMNGGGHVFSTVDAWNLPFMNTLILLLSGTTVTWAHHAIIKGDKKSASWGLALTVILGICFTGLQGLEYYEAFHERLTHGFWLDTNAYGSIFILATGFHGFHVLLGTVFLFVMWLRVLRNNMDPKQHFGFEAAAWYWHFVDVVWIFLFTFVYIVFAYSGGGH